MQEQEQNLPFNFINIPVKESFTSNIKEYVASVDWTFQQLERVLDLQITRDFNVGRGRFRLIPYGQPDSENGYDISRFQNVKLKEYWRSILEMGFYLKRL